MDINAITGVVGAVTGLVGGVSGCVALFQARHGNKLSEQANGSAEEANRIAVDSKGIAEHANDLAGKANEIAADANLISQRALSVTADQTVHKWRVEYDGETSTVFLVNDCPDMARDVSVFVRFEDQTIAQARVDKTMPFCEIALESEFFSKQIFKDQVGIDRLNSQPGFAFIGCGSCRVKVHVAYTTELGARRNDEVEQRLTNSQRH
ncbi:hypothetical protein [Bifidobacterium longum]|uniref:hypothetical protein n=1 Tax=Bifidobacterium longum TaxID=216816 RepID=UPI000E4E5322|nr:hypothetical protein [Bifidobacterium longum]RGJ79753.1 hypothetical protein DXD44_05625 [Bifidobacterium longum]